MPSVDTETKTKLRNLHRTAADLARALDVPYDRISSMLNGYCWPSPELERRIREQLKLWGTTSGCKWEEGKAQQARNGAGCGNADGAAKW